MVELNLMVISLAVAAFTFWPAIFVISTNRLFPRLPEWQILIASTALPIGLVIAALSWVIWKAADEIRQRKAGGLPPATGGQAVSQDAYAIAIFGILFLLSFSMLIGLPVAASLLKQFRSPTSSDE